MIETLVFEKGENPENFPKTTNTNQSFRLSFMMLQVIFSSILIAILFLLLFNFDCNLSSSSILRTIFLLFFQSLCSIFLSSSSLSSLSSSTSFFNFFIFLFLSISFSFLLFFYFFFLFSRKQSWLLFKSAPAELGILFPTPLSQSAAPVPPMWSEISSHMHRNRHSFLTQSSQTAKDWSFSLWSR